METQGTGWLKEALFYGIARRRAQVGRQVAVRAPSVVPQPLVVGVLNVPIPIEIPGSERVTSSATSMGAFAVKAYVIPLGALVTGFAIVNTL